MVLQSKKKKKEVPVLIGATRETVNDPVSGALNHFHHDFGLQ